MKTLYLMRHAKSGLPEPGEKDFDRTLTDRGKKDAPEMGRRLMKLGLSPDLIISSPATRAFRTAKEVAKELGYPEKKIQLEQELYDAEIEDVLHVIRSIEDKFRKVIILGHNPAFTSLVGYLSTRFIENLPTSGFVQLDFSLPTWKQVTQQSAQFVAFDYPRKATA
jgi:phosphohistidine phosphatase